MYKTFCVKEIRRKAKFTLISFLCDIHSPVHYFKLNIRCLCANSPEQYFQRYVPGDITGISFSFSIFQIHKMHIIIPRHLFQNIRQRSLSETEQTFFPGDQLFYRYLRHPDTCSRTSGVSVPPVEPFFGIDAVSSAPHTVQE